MEIAEIKMKLHQIRTSFLVFSYVKWCKTEQNTACAKSECAICTAEQGKTVLPMRLTYYNYNCICSFNMVLIMRISIS